jgi:hypothetical protein
VRIDLFELIEGFFSGIIYFLYNVVTTMAQILFRPFKAPLRLHLRHRSGRHRQIGGLTFLFLMFFGLMLAFGMADSPESSLSDASKAAFLFGKFDDNVFWLATILALIATTVTDAALRLFLAARLKARPRRAEVVIGAVELAFLSPVIGFGLLLYGLFIISTAGDRPSLDVIGWGTPGIVIVILAGTILLVLAPLPPLALLRAGLRRSRPDRDFLFPGWVNAALGSAAIWLLVTVASLAAVFPAMLLSREQFSQWYGEPPLEETVQVLDLHCHPSGTKPYADALLRNNGSRPILLQARDVHLEIDDWESGEQRVTEFAVLDDGSPPLVIQVGTGTFARFQLQPNPEYAGDESGSCSLSAPAAYGKGELFRGMYGGKIYRYRKI